MDSKISTTRTKDDVINRNFDLISRELNTLKELTKVINPSSSDGTAFSGFSAGNATVQFQNTVLDAAHGYLKLGKGSPTDTVNAGYWIGDKTQNSGAIIPFLYMGTAGDAQYLKYDPSFTGNELVLFGGTMVATAIKSTTTMTYDRGVAGTEGGYWLGKYSSSPDTYKFFIGSSATKYLKYDSTDLSMLGGTITGGIVQTDTSGLRIKLDGSDGLIKFFAAAPNDATYSALYGVYDSETGNYGIGITGNLYMLGYYMSFAGYGPTMNGKLSSASSDIQLQLSSPDTGVYANFNVINYVGGNLFTINQYSNLVSVNGGFNSGSAKFVIDANGNITKLNNVTVTFPAANAAGVLTNNGSGTLTWTAASGGSVTSVSAGNGMDFTTITTSGSVTMGTPSTITSATTNSVSTGTHTHAWTIPTNLNSLNGLTYASTSFVKMTAAGTFSLDTNTYLTSSDLTGYATLAGTNSWTGSHTFNGSLGKTVSFAAGHYFQLPGFMGVTPGQIRFDGTGDYVSYNNASGVETRIAKYSEIPSVTNYTIAPAANNDDYVPLWNGTNSKTLKNGLAYTAVATASTIVTRDTNAKSAFRTIEVGTVSNVYGEILLYGSTGNYTSLTTSAASTDKLVFFPNLGGTLIIDGGSYSNPSWITGLAWSKISSTPTTVSGYGITDAAVLTSSNTFTASNNRFRNALYLGDDTQTTDGVLVFDNGTNNLTLSITAPNTTGTSKTLTAPNLTGTIALTDADQTISGKITLTSELRFDNEVEITMDGAPESQSVAGKNTVFITVAAGDTLTLTSPTDGQILWITNDRDSGDSVTIASCRNGANTTLALGIGKSALLRYRDSETTWYAIII